MLTNTELDEHLDAVLKAKNADERRAAMRAAVEGGWLPMDSAPKREAVLLNIGETIPGLVDARVGSFISAEDADELGESLSVSGGWLVWNADADWFVIEFSKAFGWAPLPSSKPAITPPLNTGSPEYGP